MLSLTASATSLSPPLGSTSSLRGKPENGGGPTNLTSPIEVSKNEEHPQRRIIIEDDEESSGLLLLIRCKTIPPDQQIEGPYQAMQHPKRHRSRLSQPQAAHPHHHQTICRYHHSLFRLNKYNYVFLCQEPYHLNIPAPYLSGRAYFSLILMHPNHPIALLGQCMPANCSNSPLT